MIAEVLREYGPFPGADETVGVAGVSFDGQNVWFASGRKMHAFDPDCPPGPATSDGRDGGTPARTLDVAADAGTAFDGQHLYQIAASRIQKIDPRTGVVLTTIPAPAAGGASGLTWAEGTLWLGDYRNRKIHQLDPQTGTILRTIQSDRFVTGVTWVDGELWHATWEDGESQLRRVDPSSGKVLDHLDLPAGMNVSGLESDGKDRFFCGGGKTGKVRVVRRPARR